jgi:hypothetical protein
VVRASEDQVLRRCDPLRCTASTTTTTATVHVHPARKHPNQRPHPALAACQRTRSWLCWSAIASSWCRRCAAPLSPSARGPHIDGSAALASVVCRRWTDTKQRPLRRPPSGAPSSARCCWACTGERTKAYRRGHPHPRTCCYPSRQLCTVPPAIVAACSAAALGTRTAARGPGAHGAAVPPPGGAPREPPRKSSGNVMMGNKLWPPHSSRLPGGKHARAPLLRRTMASPCSANGLPMQCQWPPHAAPTRLMLWSTATLALLTCRMCTTSTTNTTDTCNTSSTSSTSTTLSNRSTRAPAT